MSRTLQKNASARDIWSLSGVDYKFDLNRVTGGLLHTVTVLESYLSCGLSSASDDPRIAWGSVSAELRVGQALPHDLQRLRVLIHQDVLPPQLLGGSPQGAGAGEEVQHPVARA